MESKQAEMFKVLGVRSRIRIIELLKERGPVGVKEMSQALGITPSAVSQHLKILRHAGLVRNERKGYWIPYEVDAAALEECAELISQVCTCGCKDTCRVLGAELAPTHKQLAMLRKREKDLRKELEEVRGRIEELQEKA